MTPYDGTGLLWTELHTFRCVNCKLYATSPVRNQSGSRYQCARCRAWMRYLFSTPITTEAQRALADRGLVHSPGVERPSQPTCSVCHDVLGIHTVALPDGTPCHYRCSPAYLELRDRRHAEQRRLNEERRTALEGVKEQNSV